MNEQNKVIPYRARWSWVIGGGLFCGLAAPSLVFAQIHEPHGLIVGHVIHLSVRTVTVIYWILAALCVGFVGLCLVLAAHRLFIRQKITLTEQSIRVPLRFWSRDEVEIPFAAIRHCGTSQFLNMIRLHLSVSSDEDRIIWYAFLPSRREQQDLWRWLHRPTIR